MLQLQIQRVTKRNMKNSIQISSQLHLGSITYVIGSWTSKVHDVFVYLFNSLFWFRRHITLGPCDTAA